jgi:hypothetical protein
MPLEWLRDYHSALFAHHICIANKADFQSFIYDCVALGAIFEFDISLLSHCNLMCSEREIFLFVATISKHLGQVAFLSLYPSFVFIVTAP